MVNKKFQIKWRSPYCEKELELTFSNLHEFAGALSAVVKDDSLQLTDVTTFACW